jgi:hypothetical protein
LLRRLPVTLLGLSEDGVFVANGHGDDLKLATIYLQGRDEVGVLLILRRELLVVAEVLNEPDLHNDDVDESLAVKGGRVRGGVSSTPLPDMRSEVVICPLSMKY